MIATTTIKSLKPKDIIEQFTKALINKDLEKIEPLLHEEGIFETHTDEFEVINSKKFEYLIFLDGLLKTTSIYSADEDVCLRCKTGNPVILYNKGQFPVKAPHLWNLEKTGLMFDINNGKIMLIKYCYQFMFNENEELNCKLKALQEMYVAQGYPQGEAYRLAKYDLDTNKY